MQYGGKEILITFNPTFKYDGSCLQSGIDEDVHCNYPWVNPRMREIGGEGGIFRQGGLHVGLKTTLVGNSSWVANSLFKERKKEGRYRQQEER